MEMYVELANLLNFGKFIRKILAMGPEIDSIQMEDDSSLDEGVRSYIISLKSKKKEYHDLTFDEIHTIKGVVYLEGL